MAGNGEDDASAMIERDLSPEGDADRELAGWILAVLVELEGDVDY